MPKPLEMIGKKFNRLTVIERAENSVNNHRQWVCRCDCGKIVLVTSTAKLISGDAKSCGCYQSDKAREAFYKHGQGGIIKTTEYIAWTGMITRCHNPHPEKYPEYTERNIRVCDRWRHSFENFFEDMGKKPSPRLTLDRINNDLGYYKENCRWATYGQQNRNRRSNIWIEFDGKRMIAEDWANEIGAKRGDDITYHLRNGKTFEWIYNHFKNKLS